LVKVHSDTTLVVSLNRHFSFWLSNFCSSISIIINCTRANRTL